MEPFAERRGVAMPEVTKKFFDAAPESVRLARQFATGALAAWGVDAAEDIRLCVSEVASNALVHGTEPGRGFLVRLAFGDGVVLLEVHDSRRDGHRPRVRQPADSDSCGRGLMIVEMLADGWGVEKRRPFGKVVWARFTVAPSVRQAPR